MEELDETLLKAITHYQSGLERYLKRQDVDKMLHSLTRLYKLPIKTCHLEKTGVGRTVNSLRKLDGKVGNAAKALVAKWKEMVVQEEAKQLEENNEHEEKPSSSHRSKEHHKNKHKSKHKHSKHDSKENKHKEKHEKRSHSSPEHDNVIEEDENSSDANEINPKKLKLNQEQLPEVINKETDSDNEENELEIRKRESSKRHKHKSSCSKKEHKDKSRLIERIHESSSSSKDMKKSHKPKETKDFINESHHNKRKKSKDSGDDKDNPPERSGMKHEKNKDSKVQNGIASGSGTSFADALGMCEPPFVKKKKGHTEKLKEPTSPPEITDDETDDLPAPKEPLVENLDINLATLLPPITPNYRPLGLPVDDQPRKIMTDDEALSRVMMNKNQRTKVYSGNKVIWGKVPNLFDLCVRVLQDNLDALEYTGGVPYSILKPILEKATANQLYMMEHHNPYLIEDSDELWKLHCQKEFRNKNRDEMETWRDMYMRCLDEREAKLRALTANIKQAQDKSLPVRTTKLAYVDSVAKPPRNIARKQLRNDNGRPTPSSKLLSLATRGEASKVAVPNPGARAMERSSSSSSHPVKLKKAPLMAKTLSLFKNRFRR